MTARSILIPPIVLLAALLRHGLAAGDSNQPLPPGSLRRPVALAVVDNFLLVAGRNGTLSVIDTDTYRVVEAMAVGRQLSALAVTRDGRYLLVTDEQAHQLLLISRDGGQLQVTQRLAVAPYPVDVVISPDGTQCSVASLWSRQISIVALRTNGENNAAALKLQPMHTVDLPFAPRRQWIAPADRWLVAADSFGGRLGIVDLRSGRLTAVRTLDGHNMRGLATSPDGADLLIAHQLLNPRTHTTHGRVFWGTLMGNQIRAIPLGELLDPRHMDPHGRVVEEPIHRWKLYPLGDTKNAAGDPGPILVTRRGTTFVALGGTNQVARQTPLPEPLRRVDVGSRPTALAVDADQSRLFVANMLSDSVSVIDLGDFSVRETVSSTPAPQPSQVDRGEQLFYDARLSLDGWFSCHSCHTDGHTNGLLSDNLNDGSFGAPKRIQSLLGAAQTGPWGWNGSHTGLESQIRKSIEQTMQGSESGRLTDDNVQALAAYLRTLQPPPSVARARGTLDEAAVQRGRLVFQRHDCGQCHTAPAYTSPQLYDVGRPDQLGVARFNPPSLRGVGQRDSFFHDGNAAQLRDVLGRFAHPDGDALPAEELQDLLAFLHSL